MAVKGSYAGDQLLRGVVAASPKIAALRARLERVPADAGYYERIGVVRDNVLTFSLQPDEGIVHTFLAKQPGSYICLRPVTMHFRC